MKRGNLRGLNFEGFQMQKRSIPPDRAQREDDNNGAIFLARLLPLSSYSQ